MNGSPSTGQGRVVRDAMGQGAAADLEAIGKMFCTKARPCIRPNPGLLMQKSSESTLKMFRVELLTWWHMKQSSTHSIRENILNHDSP